MAISGALVRLQQHVVDATNQPADPHVTPEAQAQKVRNISPYAPYSDAGGINQLIYPAGLLEGARYAVDVRKHPEHANVGSVARNKAVGDLTVELGDREQTDRVPPQLRWAVPERQLRANPNTGWALKFGAEMAKALVSATLTEEGNDWIATLEFGAYTASDQPLDFYVHPPVKIPKTRKQAKINENVPLNDCVLKNPQSGLAPDDHPLRRAHSDRR
jgi:hypothetical protein